MTQFAHQGGIRLNSKLIRGNSIVLIELLKYFNGRAISAFIMQSLSILSRNRDSHLKDSELMIGSFGSSLQN